MGCSKDICACASALRWQPPRHGSRPLVPALGNDRRRPSPSPRLCAAARPCRRRSGGSGGSAAPLLPSAAGRTPPGAGASSGRSVRVAVLGLVEEAGEKLAEGFRSPVYFWCSRSSSPSPGLAACQPGGGGGQAGLQSLCAGGGGGGGGGPGGSDAAGVWGTSPRAWAPLVGDASPREVFILSHTVFSIIA